MSLCGYYL